VKQITGRLLGGRGRASPIPTISKVKCGTLADGVVTMPATK
jgi:hypothetical protein